MLSISLQFYDCSVSQNPNEQVALEDILDLSESFEQVGFELKDDQNYRAK